MSLIFNPDGDPVSALHFEPYGNTNFTIVLTIRCRAGYELTSTAVTNVAVEGRVTGGGGFTNLETTPIDLTPYDGTDQDFDIKITSEAVTAARLRDFTLSVAPA